MTIDPHPCNAGSTNVLRETYSVRVRVRVRARVRARVRGLGLG